MQVVVKGQVGPRLVADGAEEEVRISRDAAQVVQDAHGRYTETVTRGNVFFAANQANAIFSGGLLTSVGTLTLTNPPNSGKNLAVLQADFILQNIPTPAAAGLGQSSTAIYLMVQPYNATVVTQNVPLTVRNALLGSGPSAVGLAASGSTLATTPVIAKYLSSFLFLSSSGGTTLVQNGGGSYDLGGSLVLTPGTALAFSSTSVITGSCALLWEELPI